MLFLHNTSRIEGEQYGTLLKEKGFNAFPTLCFMDADGNVLVKQGDRTVAGFDKTLALLGERQALAQKVKAGDAKAEKQLFLVDLGLGQLTAEQITTTAKKLTLTKEEQAQVDQALTDAELAAILGKQRELGADTVAEQIAAMAEAGRRPSDAQAFRFWAMTLQHASKTKNAKLAEQAFAELDQRFGKDKRYERVIPQWQKLLEQAKEK